MSFEYLGFKMNVKHPSAEFQKVRDTFQSGVLHKQRRKVAVGASGTLNAWVLKRL